MSFQRKLVIWTGYYGFSLWKKRFDKNLSYINERYCLISTSCIVENFRRMLAFVRRKADFSITSWPQVNCFLFSIKSILRSILLHLVINFIWQSQMAVSRVKEHQLFDLLIQCVLFKYTFSFFWSFGKCCLCCI